LIINQVFLSRLRKSNVTGLLHLRQIAYFRSGWVSHVESFSRFYRELYQSAHNTSPDRLVDCHKENQWPLLEKGIGQLFSDGSNTYHDEASRKRSNEAEIRSVIRFRC
jgi:hypothetical protein